MKKLIFGICLLNICFFRASAAPNCCALCPVSIGQTTIFDSSCYSTTTCNCSPIILQNPNTGIQMTTKRQSQTTCVGNTASAKCVSTTTSYSCISGFYGSPTNTLTGCNKCPENATCPGGTTFKCNKGYYYYFPDNERVASCRQCPLTGTTKGIGAISITECYIPSGTTGRDSTGSYTYTSDCYYAQ